MVVEEGEALVACSDKSMKIGVTIWDMDTGEKMLHIPTCASPPFGLLCLRNRFLVASQLNKHGSVGGGAIVVWALNKVTFSCYIVQIPNVSFLNVFYYFQILDCLSEVHFLAFSWDLVYKITTTQISPYVNQFIVCLNPHLNS